MPEIELTQHLNATFGPNWAICRKTPRMLARYDRCITQREYRSAVEMWKRENPTLAAAQADWWG